MIIGQLPVGNHIKVTKINILDIGDENGDISLDVIVAHFKCKLKIDFSMPADCVTIWKLDN